MFIPYRFPQVKPRIFPARMLLRVGISHVPNNSMAFDLALDVAGLLGGSRYRVYCDIRLPRRRSTHDPAPPLSPRRLMSDRQWLMCEAPELRCREADFLRPDWLGYDLRDSCHH